MTVLAAILAVGMQLPLHPAPHVGDSVPLLGDAAPQRNLPAPVPTEGLMEAPVTRWAAQSLLLPGWGQWSAGDAHWWGFATADLLAWVGVAHFQGKGRSFRREYRDLAWSEARRGVWDGARRDGPWEYYERMSRWSASGRFDLDPSSPGLVPETDETTFNGWIWRLAQEIHLPSGGEGGELDPESSAYRNALRYYQERAVPPELAWQWAPDSDGQGRFRTLVASSDQGFRRGTTFLGLALVNRFLSAAEVWISQHPGPLEGVPAQLRTRLLPDPGPGGGGTGWILRFELTPGSASF